MGDGDQRTENGDQRPETRNSYEIYEKSALSTNFNCGNILNVGNQIMQGTVITFSQK